MRTAGTILVILAAALTSPTSPILKGGGAVVNGFPVAQGDPAPDFLLPDLQGRMLRLSSLRGRVVVLSFWATWCAPCKVETPWLVELSARYHAQGLDVVGVSMDDGAHERVRAFAADYHMQYPVVLGDSAVADAYGGIRMLPQTFFVGRDGRILAHTLGIRNREDLERDVRQALGL